MFERILVAVDGSDNALRAVDAASAIATKFDAELVVVTVLNSLRHSAALKKFAEAEEIDEPPAELAERLVGLPLIGEAANRASTKGMKQITRRVENGDPAEEIIKVAKEMNVDLIVLGTRGLGTMRELLMGSVSHKVTHLSECPCMTVK